MDTYYKECFLEDVYHFETLNLIKELEPGQKVKLYLDEKDFDYRKKIKVSLDGKCLGVLSEDDSKPMLPLFKNGWKDIFFGRICFFDKKTETNRIKIVVYIQKK